MSATVDQSGTEQTATAVNSASRACASLDREILAVLTSEEGAALGREVAQIVHGDGWHEFKSSVVLVRAIVAWLGGAAVQPLGFYGNGIGPLEVVAKVGKYYITGFGIETDDDVTVNTCQRHRARFSQSHFEPMDLGVTNARFTMDGAMAKRATDRLAAILTEEVDPDIARAVLEA
jgi:hypothetical protein